MAVVKSFLHGTIATAAAPMLYVTVHVSPIITGSQLSIRLNSTKVSIGHCIVMAPSENFIAQGTRDDKLLIGASMAGSSRSP